MPFSDYRDNFDPETLAILEIAFISFAAEGETDPKLMALALADLPRTLETQ